MAKTVEQIKAENTKTSYELLVVRMGFTTDEQNVMCVACAYGLYTEEEQVAMAKRNAHVQPCSVCDFCDEPMYDAIKNYSHEVKVVEMSATAFINRVNTGRNE